MAFVHPFDDPHVVAGQGTVGMELLEQVARSRARDRARRRGRTDQRDRDRAEVGPPRGPGHRRAGLELRAVPGLARRPAVPCGRALGPDDRRRDRRQASRGAHAAADRAVGGRDRRGARRRRAEAIVFLLERAKLVVEGAGAVGVAALLSGDRLSGGAAGRPSRAVGGQRRRRAAGQIARRHESQVGRRLVLLARMLRPPGFAGPAAGAGG